MAKECTICKTSNRDIAKYCKHCGIELMPDQENSYDELVDREEIKTELTELVNSINVYKKEWKASNKFNMHMLITGNSGSGKTAIVNFISKVLSKNDLIKSVTPDTYDATEFEDQSTNIEQLFNQAKGGILFIDNFDKIIPQNNTSSPQADRLINQIEKQGFDPIIIVTGSKQIMDKYIADNPSFRNRFEYYFRLNDYTSQELYAVCKNKLLDFELKLTEQSALRLSSFFRHAVRTNEGTSGNAHLAVNTAGDITRSYFARVSGGAKNNKAVSVKDIKGDIPDEKSLNQLFAEFDELIGLEKVKAAVREIANHIKNMKKRKLENPEENIKVGMHLVLTGNPGTGKTMIARKLGEILAAIDYLDKGHVVEVDKSGLVSQFVGETPQKVQQKCDEAMGGILFVDEAYALAGSAENKADAHSRDAINTLLKRMEDDRDKFMVIAAGYHNEMELFVNSNTGLRSRFDRYIHIEDYKPDELIAIFKYFARKNNYNVSPEAEDKLTDIINNMYNKRDRNFANAREVRKLYEQTLLNLSNRVVNTSSEKENVDTNTILAEDLPYEEVKVKNLDEIFAEINTLIGLDNVKEQLEKMAAFVRVEQSRKKVLGKSSSIDYHYAFMGNPGTGKTTVARYIGKIFKSLGLLSKGHLVETDRSDLVGKFVGQTEAKTREVIDSAMGGVLFIDEAYSLVMENSGSDFGQHVVQTVLKRMEDDSGKFVAIIAGYPNEMEKFIHSNPGLESRFKKQIIFSDYNVDELMQIFMKFVESRELKLTSEAEKKVRVVIEELYSKRDKNFGNGRTVRNLFDSILENQSFRLSKLLDTMELDKELLITIKEEDVSL